MANQDVWARPLANTLVNLFAVNDFTYVRRIRTSYSPATGDVSYVETQYPRSGAITKLSLMGENGGVSDDRFIEAWVNLEGIDDIYPTTLDEIQYDNLRWKIVKIDPIYAGDVKYAVKLTGRAS